ncbi:MAG: hypothetical protein Q7R94_01695 [bacterium]|nr:hypothetical protein [bacterium]
MGISGGFGGLYGNDEPPRRRGFQWRSLMWGLLMTLVAGGVMLMAFYFFDQPKATVSNPPAVVSQQQPAAQAPAVAPVAKPARPTLAEIRAQQESTEAKSVAAKPVVKQGGSVAAESNGSIFLLSGPLGLLGGLVGFLLTLLVIAIVFAIGLTFIVVIVSKTITAVDAVSWYGRGAKKGFIFFRNRFIGSKVDPEDDEPPLTPARRW